MISNREVANAANEWGLRHDVVEKDYVLGWLLAGIAEHPATKGWAFKGGTCLRKCWFETYRFSEDLDFTVEDDLDPGLLATVFQEIGQSLYDRTGLALQVEEASFRQRQNRRGNRRSRAGSDTSDRWQRLRHRRSSSTLLPTKSSSGSWRSGRCSTRSAMSRPPGIAPKTT